MQNNKIQKNDYEKLSTFSQYLSNYENNNFFSPKKFIYIPNSKIKISSFDKHILVLSSIRKPKKIKIFGNDEKTYSYLIKGCEDLRLDERIEEIFNVMNDILSKDSNCMKIKIKLQTFDVIPINKRLGMIQWINNSNPLYKIIKFGMENLNNNNKIYDVFDINNINNNNENNFWDIQQSPSYLNRLKWIEKNFQGKNFNEKSFNVLYTTNYNDIINPFNNSVNLFPKFILKHSLTHYLNNFEEIINNLISFSRNYSLLSISCYILGIGDRHLENFLLSNNNNNNNINITAIDFGIAFGQGLLQYIPELVPFRLTPQIVNTLYPFGIKGIFKETMIKVLQSYKRYKENILDYCEIFIKEPIYEDNKSNKNKFNVINKKLKGINILKIFKEEINNNIYLNSELKGILKNCVKGGIDSFRFKNKDREYLDEETEVDMLNEQAMDRNLLGRMWIGWSPFV